MVDSLLGKQFGRYELRALLGAGGMARVYQAFDRTLERDVALKILDVAPTQQAEFAERFRREAHTLAGLRHPNIVQIYDYDRHKGLSFIVQQLQPGPTLEQELADLAAQGRRMERAMVVRVIDQLADALDYAHRRNIIHRDLKPSNIIRNERGDVVLTDFGIVKTASGPLVKTQTGLVLGTPGYLSPEQARGNPTLSAASDIYSLGVILFELLTGRLPFEHPQPMEVLLGHIQARPPSVRSLRPDLPAAVERLLYRALAKRPTARYATAGAFARALQDAWPAPPQVPIHTQPTALNPAPLLGALMLAPAGAMMTSAVAAIGRTLVVATPLNFAQRWWRWVCAAIALLTLPVLLMVVVALFFTRLPGTKPAGPLPTIVVRFSTPSDAVGLLLATDGPTQTLAPTLAFTAKPTRTALPSSTSTVAPTRTAAPTPTFPPTQQPEQAPPAAAEPAFVPPPAPPQAPEPPFVPEPTFAPPPPPAAPQAPEPTLAPPPPTSAPEPAPTVAEPLPEPPPPEPPALPAEPPQAEAPAPPPEPPPQEPPTLEVPDF